MAHLDLKGTPEAIPLFAGTGVHDVIVRVDKALLQQRGYVPDDCFEFTGPQIVADDRGAGVLVESRIAEVPEAGTDRRGSAAPGLELRVVADTRYLVQRADGDGDLRVDVRFPFTPAFQRVLDCFRARPPTEKGELLVSCPAASIPDAELADVPHERLEPEGETGERAYFVLEGQTEVPATLRSKLVRREPQTPPGPLSLLVLRGGAPQEAETPPLEMGLALDLGNTRSFGLVLDDLYGREGAKWQLRRLSMVDYITWDGHEPGRSQRPDAGVFDSVLTFASPARFESSTRDALDRSGLPPEATYGQPLSFVRVGQGAFPLQRSLLSDPAPGRYALSSPKRYFWEDDAEHSGWKAFTPRDGFPGKPLGDGRPLADDAPLAKRLAEQEQHEARRISRSAVLSATIGEFLEQAEGMMNHPVTLLRSDVRSRRLVSAVCVTHPPGWSSAECALYRDKICRGLDAFCSLRALPLPDAYVECDEASAALLGYLYSEIRKFGGQAATWLTLIGRIEGGAPRVRVGTIDLGGGTSDLVVTEISASSEGTAVVIGFKRLHRDGLNTAGDEMLRRVVEEIVLPELGRRFFPSSDAWKPVFNELLVAAAADDRLSSWRNRWAREIWFPLAVKMLEGIAAGGDAVLLGDLDGLIRSFGSEDDGLLWPVVQRLRLANAYKRWQSTEGAARFAIPKDASRVLTRICEEVFEPIARRFAASITAFDCDVVIAAGKTSEVPYVKETFRRNTPVPHDRFVTLQGYYTGRWCSLADPQGRIADAKVTTVLGAAVFLMAKQHSPALGANMRIEVSDAPIVAETNHYWGIVNSQNLRFSRRDVLFGPGTDRRATVNLSSTSVLIGRRPYEWEVQEAQIAYELRLRPKYRDYGAPEDARVELECVTKGPSNVELVLCGVLDGRFRNGMALRTEHLELRPRILGTEGFWMDEGGVVSRPFQ
jgi:hypothetical protein